MNDLLLHPSDRERLGAFTKRPGHALLLVGPAGSGKSTLASRIGETVLGLGENELDNYPYVMALGRSGEKSIGIDEVRELERFLSLKVPRPGTVNRLVIIENAQLLGIEAQNALLKTLEEPPEGTLLMLTSTYEQALLPTIRSRTQIITLQLPTEDQVRQYFQEQGHSSQKINQAYAMSGGLPGLLSALLQDGEHPLLAAAEQAKNLLRASAYDRLTMVDELSKQRTLTEATLTMLQQMAHLSLRSAQGAAAKRWKTVLEAAYEAQESLQKNGQPKLVLTELMLSL